MSSLLRNDRGAAGLIEFALVAPVLLLVVLGGINIALAQHARELATVAAAEAARAAAVAQTGAETAGVKAGRDFLTAASGMALGVCPTGSGFGTVDVDVKGGVGSDVEASVDWCFVNLFGGFVTLLGGSNSVANLGGTVVMTVRKEGW